MSQLDDTADLRISQLFRPVLLGYVLLLAVLVAMAVIAVRQIDNHLVEVQYEHATQLVTEFADRPTAEIAALLLKLGYENAHVVTGDVRGAEQEVFILTAEGLRLGAIAYLPTRPARDVFVATMPGRTPFMALSAALMGFLLWRLHEKTKKIEQQRLVAREAALTDGLSGLPNRRRFSIKLQMVLRAVMRGGPQVTLYFIDLDGFKSINDSYGHAAGDALIRQVAQRLEKFAIADDLVARLSGDEFALISTRFSTPAGAKALGWQLVEHLAEPAHFGNFTISFGASVGIAQTRAGFVPTPSDLSATADKALYAAKTAGRGRAVFYTPDIENGTLPSDWLNDPDHDIRSA